MNLENNTGMRPATYRLLSNFFIQHRAELLISFLSFVTCLGYFTLTTDDYGAFSYFNLPAGQFSNYCHFEYYFLGFVGLAWIYELLYAAYPAFNWIGISFIGFVFLAFYYLLRSIKTVLFSKTQNSYLPVAFQLLFALFFVENIISMSHTRFSLVFCGIGLFNLAFTKGISVRGIILNTLVFILGILIRPESGLGMLLLVSIGYLIYNFDVIHLAKRIFLPVLFTVSLFSFFAYDWAHTDIYMKKVEPEIEYKIMDRRIVPLSEMKTASDSVKYEAAMTGMWFDVHTMTPDYLRSLLLPGINLSAEHAGKVFLHTLSFYGHYIFVPCLVLALLIVCLFTPGYRKVIFKIILFQIATFLVIYAVDFNGRLVGERHFLNLQLVALLVSTYYLFGNMAASDLPRLSKPLLAMAMLVITAGTVPTLLNYKTANNSMAADIECYEAAMEEIENTFSNRLIVATISNVYLLNRSFSVYTNNYIKNKYIMFDVFTYSLAPGYLNYLGSQCQCNPTDPVAFYQWLSDNRALYIAEPARYDLTERYMHLVHRQQIKFTSISSFKKPSCIVATEMTEFEVRTVTLEN